MKAYGVKVEEWADCADLAAMGAKSSASRFRGKGGDYRASQKTKAKNETRRYWARKARQDGKLACLNCTES